MGNEMSLNATLHVDQDATFVATKSHDLRTSNTKSNKDIRHRWSDMNVEYTHDDLGVDSVDSLLHQHYDDYIQTHDDTQIAQRHPGRCYHTIDNYINSYNKDTKLKTARGIFNSGDMVDKMRFLKSAYVKYPDKSHDEIKAKFFKAANKTAHDFGVSYNKKNKAFPMTDMITNVDEKGTPHAHIELVPMGHTSPTKRYPHGKPSNSYYQAVATVIEDNGLGRSKNDTVNLKKWRAMNDQMLLDITLNNLKQEFPDIKVDRFKLTRSDTPNVGRSMQVFKKVASSEKRAQRIKSLADKTFAFSKSLYEKATEIEDKNNERSKQLDQREKQLKKREDKADSILNRETHVKKREDNVKAREDDVSNRERDVKTNVINMGSVFRQIKSQVEEERKLTITALSPFFGLNQNESLTQYNSRLRDYATGAQTVDTKSGPKSGFDLVMTLARENLASGNVKPVNLSNKRINDGSHRITSKQKSFKSAFDSMLKSLRPITDDADASDLDRSITRALNSNHDDKSTGGPNDSRPVKR